MRKAGLNKHRAAFTTENSAADEACQRWLCREMQETGRNKRREAVLYNGEGSVFIVLQPPTLPEETFHNQLLTPPL